MKKLQKTMATILASALLMTAGFTGCSSPGSSSSIPAQEESSAIPAAPEEAKDPDASAADTVFNPDTEADTIPYDQLEEKFGPVPLDAIGADTKVGGILKNLANEFWLMLGDGMTAEGETLGIQTELQATRTETDVAGQLSLFETMLENDYDAIMLSPLTNNNLDSAVQTAISRGIPVVNVNCEYIAECDTFVGGLQIEIGHKGAQYIAEKIGGAGKVAIIEGVPGTFTSIQRVNGFRELMEAEYKDIEIVASVPADYEMEKGMNVAADILTQNPEIKALYCANDNMALGAVEALRAANLLGQVVVIGVDGTAGAYDSIKKGEMTATVDQFPDINGKAAVEVAARLLAGQDIPKVVSTPIEVVDKDNMAQYGK